MVSLSGRKVETAAELCEVYSTRVRRTGFSAPTMFYRSVEQHEEKVAAYGEQLAQLVKGDSLLDVGCGWGALVPVVPAGVRYSGVDIQTEFIREAKRRFPAREFVECNFLELADLTCDWAVLMGVLSSVPNPHELLEVALSAARVGVMFDLTIQSRLPSEFSDLNRWDPSDASRMVAPDFDISDVVDAGRSWLFFRAERRSE